MKAAKCVLLILSIFILACEEDAPNEPTDEPKNDDPKSLITWEQLALNVTGSSQTTGSEKVFAVDGEGNYYAGYYTGIFKSENTGESWEKISDYHYICVDVNGTIYAKGFDDNEYWYYYYRSSDYGQTWEKYCRALYEDEIGTIRANSKGSIIVWKSDDGYSDHLDLYDGGWTQNIFESEGEYIHDFFLSSNDVIFCNADRKIFRSSDNGITWNNIELPEGVDYTFCEDDLSNYYLAVDDHVYFSTDDGVRWSLIAEGLNHVSLRVVDENKIYFTASLNGSNSLYVTESSFSSYSRISFPISPIGSVFANGNHLFVQTDDKGIYYSHDGGNTWSTGSALFRKPLFASWNSIAINKNGTIHTGHYLSTNKGDTWHQTNKTNIASFNIDSDESGDFYMFIDVQLFHSPENAKTLQPIGSGGLWVFPDNFLITKTGRFILNTSDFIGISDDKGITWQVSFNLPGYWTHRMTETNNGFLYLNYWGKGLYISKDDGETWTWKDLESFGHIVDIGGGFDNSIYFVTSEKEIFKSDDYGETWEEYLDFKDQELSLKTFFIDSKNTIYVGGESRLIYTANLGEEWLEINYQAAHNGPRIVESPDGEIYVASENNWITKGIY